MNRLKAVYRSWAILVREGMSTIVGIERSGWTRLGKPACGVEPNDSMSNTYGSKRVRK